MARPRPLPLLVLSDRRLRPVALSLLAHGMAQGMTIPFIALWLMRAYGRGAGATAAVFTVLAIGGIVTNPWLGRLSDRTGSRRTSAVTSALLAAAGLTTLATHPPFWVVLIAAGAFVSCQVQPPLFALAHDHIGPGTSILPRATAIATLRAMISAAWVVGAPLGGLLLEARSALPFAVAALCNLCSALVTIVLCREAPSHPTRQPSTRHSGRPLWIPLLLFGFAVVLIIAGNSAKLQVVPVYLSRLGLDPFTIGLFYSWMALAELVLMPLVGQWADRAPRRSVIVIGTLGGTLFFTALSLGGGAWTVLGAFPAVALMVSAIYGVGIGYVQELDPKHAGLGGGIFFAAQGIGMALGGPLIAWAEHVLGLPLAFVVPALAIATGAFVVIATHPHVRPLVSEAAEA